MSKSPSTRADRGYMGDRSRGASMGRGDIDPHTVIKRLREEIADDTSRADDHESDPHLDWHIWPAGSDARADMIGAARSRVTKNQARLDALICWTEPTTMPRVHLAEIRLDSGGYDTGGAYWGHGGWPWEAWTDDGAYYQTGRVYRADIAATFASVGGAVRETAKRAVRESLPDARFYR